MATAPSPNAVELFQQAIANFQAAIRHGLRAQEDSTAHMADLLRDLCPPLGWQENAQTWINETLRVAQHSIDESIRMANSSARATIQLWQKIFECESTEFANGEAANGRTGGGDGLWELAFEMMKINAQAVLQANARLLQAWALLARDLAPHAEEDGAVGA